MALETTPRADYAELMLDFLAYLEFERGLSRNTLEAYRSDLLQFGRFLAAAARDALTVSGARPPTSWIRASRRCAAAMAARRRPRRSTARPPACGPSTATCAARPLDHDPTAALVHRAVASGCPRCSRAARSGASAGSEASDPAALRDRALLEVMYACGLRASEAIGLEVTDVDLDEGLLRARGKGSKDALCRRSRRGRLRCGPTVPRPPGDWWAAVERALFVNFRGQALTRQGLYKIVRRHARSVGLADA